MHKPFTTVTYFLALSLFCFSNARAQQASTTTTQQPTASGSQPSATAKTQNPAPKKAITAPTGKKPAAVSTAKKAPAPLVLTTPKEKASYAIGMSIGKNLHRDSVDIDPAIFLQGLKDAMAGGKLALTDDEARAVLNDLQAEVRKTQQEKLQALAVSNKKDGEAFLSANKTATGVVTLPSGLQYKILKPGDGPKPMASDTVTCNYRGTFLDGSEFDSSYKRGQPASFQVGGIIKGWNEALQLMPVGSKWELFVPPDLAYGDRGAPPVIGPNATLVFEVELLSIQAASKPSAPAAQPNASPAAHSTAQPAAQPAAQAPTQPASRPAIEPPSPPKPPAANP